MFIRDVKDSDIIELYNLFKSCFRVDEISLTSRYKVAIEDDKIVAVSGILPVSESNYQGYEIDWTCCHTAYRGRGYVSAIIRECLNELPDDKIPVYCSCCEDLWILQR